MQQFVQCWRIWAHHQTLRPAAVVALWIWTVIGTLSSVATAQELRWTQPTGHIEVPPSPTDPTAAKVYSVFDKNCASCHQTGKSTLPAPAGGFGGILDLPTLAADPTRIRAGLPDASPMYTMLQEQPWHGLDASKDIELTSVDLDVLREWISSLKPDAKCERQPVSQEDAAAAVSRYLETAGAAAKSSRFLTLTHFFNACATEAEMKAYRQAVATAVNGVSWGLKPIVLAPVDSAETIFRIDLSDMGWDEGRWSRLLATYPYRSPDLETAIDAPAAISIRADWFVAAALSPPLYYELLGLPDRLSTLTASLRLDLNSDVLQNRARRIGIKTSTVARGSRLLQRSTFANGGFWVTYEYAPTPGRPDLFETPGGPGSRGASRPDGSLVMFALPNGFNAFFITNGDGQRVNDLPLSVVRNETHPARRLSAGGACMACHAQGPRPATDELKTRVTGDTSIPRDIREKVMNLAASDDEMKLLIASDTSRTTGALVEAGVIPGTTLDGSEPVAALSRRYRQDVSIETLAAELGVSVKQLRETAGKAKGRAGDVIDRLVHGLVPRRTVEAAAGSLAASMRQGLVPPIDPDVGGLDIPGDEPQPRLVLKSGPVAFKVGDVLGISARTSESCYLTLINVDRNGRGTVVFPNDFEQNNFIEAGKEIRVPADAAPYVFRLRDPGRETVVGICQTGSKVLPGIRHDFERQRFTELGDYKVFLSRLNLADADTRPQALAKGAPEVKARRRGRSTAPGQSPAGAARSDVQMRAVAIVDVTP